MGSACFSRGSKQIAETVHTFLEERPDLDVDLRGSLCTGNCEKGPVMTINGKLYENLDEEKAFVLLRRIFKD